MASHGPVSLSSQPGLSETAGIISFYFGKAPVSFLPALSWGSVVIIKLTFPRDSFLTTVPRWITASIVLACSS